MDTILHVILTFSVHGSHHGHYYKCTSLNRTFNFVFYILYIYIFEWFLYNCFLFNVQCCTNSQKHIPCLWKLLPLILKRQSRVVGLWREEKRWVNPQQHTEEGTLRPNPGVAERVFAGAEVCVLGGDRSLPGLRWGRARSLLHFHVPLKAPGTQSEICFYLLREYIHVDTSDVFKPPPSGQPPRRQRKQSREGGTSRSSGAVRPGPVARTPNLFTFVYFISLFPFTVVFCMCVFCVVFLCSPTDKKWVPCAVSLNFPKGINKVSIYLSIYLYRCNHGDESLTTCTCPSSPMRWIWTCWLASA